MSDTPNLGLTYLEAAQAQKHVTVNEALRRLDALVQIAVLDRNLAAPPAAPADGARYIVAASPTGAWSGHAGEIAAFQDGAWAFLEPQSGWIAYIADEQRLLVRGATAWGDLPAQNLPLVGIVGQADAVNRLTVKSNGALFSHDDVTPGTGDMRLTLNKSATARDGGLVWQVGYSTRAIAGLLADDSLSFKTAPDGSTFRTALILDKATGAASLPVSPRFSAALTADVAVAAGVWTKIGFNLVEHNAQTAFAAATGRFTASFPGSFRLAANLTFKANGAVPTAMNAAFYRNGAIVSRTARAVAAPATTRSCVALDEVLQLAANDFVEVYALMEGGAGFVDAARSGFAGHHIP
jgi:hypothetical protein